MKYIYICKKITMKKGTLSLVVVFGLLLGTATLFGQASFGVMTINPIHLNEKKLDSGIEGTWKIHKVDGNIVKNDLTKTFSTGGVLISKQGRVTKKQNGKLKTKNSV